MMPGIPSICLFCHALVCWLIRRPLHQHHPIPRPFPLPFQFPFPIPKAHPHLHTILILIEGWMHTHSCNAPSLQRFSTFSLLHHLSCEMRQTQQQHLEEEEEQPQELEQPIGVAISIAISSSASSSPIPIPISPPTFRSCFSCRSSRNGASCTSIALVRLQAMVKSRSKDQDPGPRTPRTPAKAIKTSANAI